ncbi:sensor histidine kinase [Alistipes sp.]|uniref:sensor histidine kinase n=1 Tax=Alistipes sp. TaxID=1872444 RepID=UPI003AEFC035
MKLILRIALHLAWLLLAVLAVWSLFFYWTIDSELKDEMDDSLDSHAELLIERSLAGRLDAVQGSGWMLRGLTDKQAAALPHVRYSDEKTYIPGHDEREHARVLRTVFRDAAGSWYELTVMTPTLGREDLREAILGWVLCLYGALLITVLAVSVMLLYRMMRPLYALLRWLDAYRVGGENPPLAAATTVTEFRRLNEAAMRYAARAESLFERQKQFIGNASHEMQTPLAVCRNRLEMLADDASLGEEQLLEIARVQRSLDYLVRLNRSLLLLSKIENGQFPEAEEVDFSPLLRGRAEELAEIYGGRGIRFCMREEGSFRVRMNPTLAESLVVNLLKNAFVHNVPGGEVVVAMTDTSLKVCNTASAGPLDGERVFERFYRGEERREGSTGLGLAIAEAVCRLCGLRIGYAFERGLHCFTVEFSGKN